MLLSIGMIVKNEEKYLEQCLNGLKPILENVDSELIIADTGSTDRSVEIAKKFTDNVFHFEWIDDFAAARNSTMEKAQGEWYMFIDADEIIKDASDLINFFNSGEYKNYGSATYVQRNYNDLSNMSLFTDFRPRRLTQNTGVRFIKPIHEGFNIAITPIKDLNVIADHYGYIYRDHGKLTELSKTKTDRNLKLLFEKVRTAEENNERVEGSVYGQIADCYLVLNEFEKTLEYSDLALENIEPKHPARISHYIRKIKTLNNLERFSEINEICDFYFSKDNLCRTQPLASDCCIHISKALALIRMDRIDESVAHISQGFDVYRKYKSGSLQTAELNFVPFEVTIPTLKMVCNILFKVCLERKKFSVLGDQLKNIPINDFCDDSEFMRGYLSLRIELMEQTNYNKISELYYQLDKPNRELFVTLLNGNILKTSKRTQFLKKLAMIGKEDERLADMLTIFNSHFVSRDLTSGQLTDFIAKYGIKGNEIVMCLLMICGYDITPFICAEDYDNVKTLAEIFVKFNNPESAAAMFVDYKIGNISDKGLQKALDVYQGAVYAAIVKNVRIFKLVKKLADVGMECGRRLNSEEFSEKLGSMELLNEALELDRKKKYAQSIEKMNELAQNDKSYAPIAEVFAKFVEMEEKRDKEMREFQLANPELVDIAYETKCAISEYLSMGELDDAEEMLDEMTRMVPFDVDFEDLRDRLTVLKDERDRSRDLDALF